MRAVDRYDWRREIKFSTYAARWIRHAIGKAIATTAQPIRLPDSVRARIADVRRTDNALTSALGRRPSVSEIAAALDLTIVEVAEARAAALPVGSLDAPLGADGDGHYADVLADPNAPDPGLALVDATPAIDLVEELHRLPERSRRVLELRYGLRDGVARTAESVADELGVARERVRQIELQTLRVLAAAAAPLAHAA
jgi:RNA polymerase primary sigma factor